MGRRSRTIYARADEWIRVKRSHPAPMSSGGSDIMAIIKAVTGLLGLVLGLVVIGFVIKVIAELVMALVWIIPIAVIGGILYLMFSKRH